MTLEELERRLKALEDKEEIKDLHREYLFYISELDFDRALDCFTDDIEVEVANYGRLKGKTAVEKFFRDVIYQNVLRSKDGHFTGQPVVTIDGERGKGHWMFYRFLADPVSKGWVQGRYDCEYAKQDGRWKFSILKMVRPWPQFLGSDTPAEKGADL